HLFFRYCLMIFLSRIRVNNAGKYTLDPRVKSLIRTNLDYILENNTSALINISATLWAMKNRCRDIKKEQSENSIYECITEVHNRLPAHYDSIKASDLKITR
ncbi:MAG: hypothetical protein WCO49_20705, partial [Nostocales cyanobacterium ELA608]